MKILHWQIPLSRRFRSLKLWFVIRSFGVEGIQRHVREGIRLAKKFELMVAADDRFELPTTRHLGMVVFRLKGDNDNTEMLLRKLNSSGKVHMVPASFKGKYVIRFTVTSQYTKEADIQRDWAIIQETARKVLCEEEGEVSSEEEEEEEEAEEQTLPLNRPLAELDIINRNEKLSQAGQLRREGMKRKEFGLSLILSHVPRSPKFINGSFAALFDNNDVIMEYARHLSRKSLDFNGRPIRLSPRKRLKEQNKQYSFDLSLFPSTSVSATSARRRNLLGFQGPQKQGSLDSKIEEIFDTSSQASYDDSDPDVDGGEAINGSRVTWNGNKAVVFGLVNVEKEDKGVQSPPVSDEQDSLYKTPAGQGGNHGMVIVNGMKPVVCKHCGHLVEET